jgi:dihydroneopterin aldolase
MNMFRIHIRDFKCIAYHGVFPEERAIGQEFVVDVEVMFPAAGMVITLEQTIDYSRLLEIVRAVMAEPEPLLETVAMKIAGRVGEEFPQVTGINISIEKPAAPITTFGGRVGVRYEKRCDGPVADVVPAPRM